jgi:signal transduction histidine kinase
LTHNGVRRHRQPYQSDILRNSQRRREVSAQRSRTHGLRPLECASAPSASSAQRAFTPRRQQERRDLPGTFAIVSTDDADGADGIFACAHSGSAPAFTRKRDLNAQRPEVRLRERAGREPGDRGLRHGEAPCDIRLRFVSFARKRAGTFRLQRGAGRKWARLIKEARGELSRIGLIRYGAYPQRRSGCERRARDRGLVAMKRLRNHEKTRRAARTARSPVASRSELQEQLAELIDQRSAISEVLRAIADSPHDLQPTFQAILDSATRLCRAEAGIFRLVEEAGLRLVAHKVTPVMLKEYPPPTLLEHSSFVARFIASKSPLHIPNLAEHEVYRAGEAYPVGLVKAGLRTALYVPMLRNGELMGVLSVGRMSIEPFTEKEIQLVTDFAAEAAIALEITRREQQLREVQTELAHANRVATMGQLTASITHELKQPMAAVRTDASAALRWLNKTPPDLTEVRDALASIVRDTDRAGDVVARIEALMRKAPPRKEVLDLNEAIMEVIALTHSEATKTGVRIGTQLAPCLPRIHADRVQLQQVILNLIVNGIQAMNDVADGQRDLLITTEDTENGVRVEARDTGTGLSPENLEHLFEAFYTNKPNGMGMGLSICRTIIKAHGGRLWATEQPRGALFQFTIPTN